MSKLVRVLGLTLMMMGCGDNQRVAVGVDAAVAVDAADAVVIDAAVIDAAVIDAPPPIGAWQPAGGGFAGVPCADGLRFAAAGDVAWSCTVGHGIQKGAVAGDAIAWTAANASVDNLAGRALALHPINANTLLFAAAPVAGGSNWYRTGDTGATWTPAVVNDGAGAPRTIYAARVQPQVGNMLGSWDAPAQAIVLTGASGLTVRPVATATGTVRGFAGSAATNLYAAVDGRTPGGAAATGGVFRSVNNAVSWTAQDTGLAAADKDRVLTVTMDATDVAILYAGLRGGGLLYKTVDAGATWTASASGLPAGAEVTAIAIAPQDHRRLYAATTAGLYLSTDGGAAWTLAGFPGRDVRAVAISATPAALVLVGVADEVGLYRPLP